MAKDTSQDPFKDDVAISDDIEIDHQVGDEAAATPTRKPYTVICESGLFKNGTHYPTGETVQLDDDTAANFIAAGDVEAQ